MIGSSPRMWGTLQGDQFEQVAARFIPTHVGNTSRRSSAPSPTTVHPHACGEHAIIHRVYLSSIGSSPRMWGTPRSTLPAPRSSRFIPTHVGNTHILRGTRPRLSVHPHACGEHFINQIINIIIIGSSPRMWGTRKPLSEVGWRGRFIPTHVGNT